MSDQQLWERILRESSQTQRYGEGNLIVVGGRNSGAKSLIAALQRGPGSLGKSSVYTQLVSAEDSVPVCCPLLYSYVNSKDPADPGSDKISKINVFALDQPELKGLLELALNSRALDKTLFAIALDWEQPWRFQQDLANWVDIWHEVLGNVVSRLPLEEQDQLVKSVSEYVKSYREPDSSAEINPGQELPLAEGVLQINLGVPILVVCCKSDLIWAVDKNRENTEKILDLVLKELREFCVTYGASLFYTSSKTGANVQKLYDYIMHRVYAFPFSHKPEINARDEILVPSGWDSPSLIQQTVYAAGDKQVQELLPRPKNKHISKEEAKVTSDQDFLLQIKDKIESSKKTRREGVGLMIQKTNATTEVPAPPVENKDDSAGTGSQAKLQEFYKKLLQGRSNTDNIEN
jgi:dynein light intermediate chain 1, cytosolic